MSSYGADWDVPERFNFTRDVVERLADDPSRRALTFVDATGIVERLSFAEIARRADTWAQVLRARGLASGARVLVLLGKRPEWHAVVLGALKAGLVVVPCSEMLRPSDLAFRARHSGARLLVTMPGSRPTVQGLRSLVEGIDVLEIGDEPPLLGAFPTPGPTQDTRHDDPAFILYTSGTTKEPKGVVQTHAYTFASRMQAEIWLDAGPDDLVWCTAGTGWAKSIWNVLLGPWSLGAEVVVHEGGFDPTERLELIERLGVTVLCQAPTEYRLMAKLEELERFDLGRLRHAVSAGEPLNPEVIKVFRETFGVTIHDGYGQTENSLLVANTRRMEVRPGSMGLPTPGHRVGVIDEAGVEVAPGVEGDIAVFGTPPTLFAGYWNDPEATLATRRNGWYVTGDRAIVDGEGYLWFTGRSDDVILSAAYRIGPFEVESALLEHPAVAESAAIGKPDPDRGQIVKAFVVTRPGVAGTGDLARELQEHVKAVTAPYKYPREIEFVSSLPKTTSGKIRRVELRRLEEERSGETGAAAEQARAIAAGPSHAHRDEAERAEEEAAAVRAEAARIARQQEEEAARARGEAEARARAEEQRVERERREAETRARAEAEARRLAESDAIRRKAEDEEDHREAERAPAAEEGRAAGAESPDGAQQGEAPGSLLARLSAYGRRPAERDVDD